MATPTVLDIITDALTDLGVLAASETPSAGDAALGLRALNSLIDQLAAEGLGSYTITRTTWSLVSGTQVYTLGSGGDINIPWTPYIAHVRFVNTSQDPVAELPLNRLTDDGWARVTNKALQSALPQSWYPDFAYPLNNISLWPIPTSADLQGVVYAATPVAEFAALTDLIALPPGYRRMFGKMLAVELGPSFTQVNPSVLMPLREAAIEAKAFVKASNARPMDMAFDAGALQWWGRPFYWNLWVGP